MELFNPKSNIDFMGARKWTTLLSILLFIVSIGVIATKGLNWGLDFTGGSQLEVAYQQPANLQDIRERLRTAGFPEAKVISYGTSRDVLISVAPRADLEQTEIAANIMAALPDAEQRRFEFVGSQVGAELATKGALAIIVALLATMVYIALRFEYRFAISSAVALIHDPLVILGIFAWFQLDFDLKTLAALLAVIGYSLNDTIVVFDRARENFRKMRKASVIEIMNASINQTLSRTIITSVLTLVVIAALFIYGGETNRNFAFAFGIGIIIGTYSSIYVAGTLAIAMGLKRSDLLPTAKAEIDDRP